jgi:nitrogenase molybdenum-iron protein alpha/beta subunit
MLSSIDLRLVSVWLNGGHFDDLKKIKNAGLIISLPYARKAAAVLAKRLDVPIVETDLPFGIEGTRKWLETVAEYTGKNAECESFIDKRLYECIPRLEWTINYYFLQRKMIYMGDPHLLKGIIGMTGELGMTVRNAVITCKKKHCAGLDSCISTDSIFIDPRLNTLRKKLQELYENERIHLLVGPSDAINLTGSWIAYLEFGYPSYFTHALYQRPFLGFSWAMSFIERMANEMRIFEVKNREKK